VSQIYAPNNTYQVIMELDPEFMKNPQALSMLLRPRLLGRARAARRRRPKTHSDSWSARVNHSGQAPSVDAVIQPQAPVHRSAKP